MKPLARKLSFWLFLLLIILITASNHPTIVQMSKAAGLMVGSILSRYIIMVYALLFLCCFKLKELFKSKVFKNTIVMLMFVGLYAIMVLAFYSSKEMLGDIRAIGICVVAVGIGWLLALDYKQYLFLIVTFSLATTLVGLSQVFVNIGGFVIDDQLLTDNKNSLGVMFATSAFILWQLYSNSQQGDKFRTVLPIIVVLILAIMLTTRVRSALLVIMIMLFLSLFEHKKRSTFVIYLLATIIGVTLALIFLPGVRGYILDSFLQNSQGDITSGRMERNAIGINFLMDNIFTGTLGTHTYLQQIHNYPLNRICEYGIVFSFPIILIYFYFVFVDVKRIRRTNAYDNWNLGYYVLLIPIINSLTEPTFPFGPGTASVFNFILFGISLKYTYINCLQKAK